MANNCSGCTKFGMCHRAAMKQRLNQSCKSYTAKYPTPKVGAPTKPFQSYADYFSESRRNSYKGGKWHR